MAVDSAIGSLWTMVSRASGLVRVVVVAAVLGPTQFGDLYQATNLLPNLTFELLTGALFGSLVVPALVRHLDAQDERAAARLASGFMTVALLAAGAVVLLSVVTAPLLLRLLTAGVPADTEQTDLGPAWLLLSLLMVQVPCYVLIGMAASVQQARGRFAIAAAAPVVENLGIIATLLTFAAVFAGQEQRTIGMAEVGLLGGGTTLSVALHAAIQWSAARRAGVALTLSNGARDAEVRSLLRLAVPSSANAGLNVARYFCLLVVAAAVPGGVIALTLALNFYNLPIALGARTVAHAAMPGLARAHDSADDAGFGEAFNSAFSLVLFLTLPAAVGYLLLAEPLAVAVALGEMAGSRGQELIRYSLIGISLGIAGEAALSIATQASYAHRDGAWPLRAVALRTTIGVVGMLVSLQLFDGAALLLAIGAVVTVGDVVAGWLLCWHVRRRLPRARTSLLAVLARTALASGAMAAVLVLLLQVDIPSGQLGAAMYCMVGAVLGAVSYVLVQRLLGASEAVGLLRVARRAAL